MSVLCFGMSHYVYTVSWSSEGSWRPFHMAFHIAPNSVCAAWWERRKQKTTDSRMWKFVSRHRVGSHWNTAGALVNCNEEKFQKWENIYRLAFILYANYQWQQSVVCIDIDIWKVTLTYWRNKSCDINRSVRGVLTLQGSWISSLNSPIFNFQLMTRLISVQNKAGARVRI